MSASPPKIIAYLKTYCGWSYEVRTVLREYGLEFTEKDIIKNPAFRWEMEQKSGQSLSPCVLIDGTAFPGIRGEPLERELLDRGIVKKTSVQLTSGVEHIEENSPHPFLEG